MEKRMRKGSAGIQARRIRMMINIIGDVIIRDPGVVRGVVDDTVGPGREVGREIAGGVDLMNGIVARNPMVADIRRMGNWSPQNPTTILQNPNPTEIHAQIDGREDEERTIMKVIFSIGWLFLEDPKNTGFF
jgi:hypothetical protein